MHILTLEFELIIIYLFRVNVDSVLDMKIQYLEIVTKDVDGVCSTYAEANGVQFGQPDASLGNARTATLSGGGMVGVRGPLRDDEAPIVRPYWLVDDIDAAVAAAEKAGAKIAMAPTKIPSHGTFAIYVHGGIDHGVWCLAP